MKRFKPKQDLFDYTMPRTCKTCEHEFHGKYCNRCGEKVIEPFEKSFKTFLGSIFSAVTFIDSKFFRTLRMIMIETGQLSHHYINGRRVPFVRPVSLFFIANLLYFLFPVFQTYNSTPGSADVFYAPPQHSRADGGKQN